MMMTSSEFGYLRALLREHAGIALEPGKEYLAESRLMPLAAVEGFGSLSEMFAQLRSRSANGLHRQVVEAMATNETTFFRDFPAFEAVRRHALPELIRTRADSRLLNVWSAACSSGQEPYSLAMMIREHFPALASWSVSILASDLSETMAERARAGVYDQIEINRGLPAKLLVKYFEKHGTKWSVRRGLRDAIDVRTMNLAGPWPPLPEMHLILMRNVLIYMETETRRAVLAKVREVLAPDGYLLLGATETTHGIDDAFERLNLDGATFHRLRPSGETRS